MKYGLVQTTPPTTEPVSVQLLKSHLRIYTDTEDALLAMYITSARTLVEEYTQRQLMPATWTLYLDSWFRQGREYAYNPLGSMYLPVSYWPDGEGWRSYRQILLPRSPVTAVSSIQYQSTGDTLTTLSTSDYIADLTREPARIVLNDWPSLSIDLYPKITIIFTAGYATVPSQLCHMILLLAASYYRSREVETEYSFNKLPLGFHGLLDVYRIYDVSEYGL